MPQDTIAFQRLLEETSDTTQLHEHIGIAAERVIALDDEALIDA